MRIPVLAPLLFAMAHANVDPTFDHQTKTYTTSHKEVKANGSGVSITPFFSPEQSSFTLARIVQEANVSIDIGCTFASHVFRFSEFSFLASLAYLPSKPLGFRLGLVAVSPMRCSDNANDNGVSEHAQN